VRRFWFLLAGAALWLFLFVIPALADGGPHMVLVNSGSSTLTADSCAGCHRAHTAQGEFLLKASSEEALCLSCHGSSSNGATTNVELGVQFRPAGDGTRTGVELGALRDGGFLTAYINASAPTRLTYQRGWNDSPFNLVAAISTRPKVGAIGTAGTLGTAENTTSAHIDIVDPTNLTNGIADQQTVWGKGVSGLGTAAVTLTCVDCHNPHGNGNYRILRPVPGLESDPLGSPTSVEVVATYANADTIVMSTQHGLVAGDTVQFSGSVANLANAPTTYVVTSVVNGFTIKVATALAATGATTAFDINANWTGSGLVVRTSVSVADVPVDPDGLPGNGIENPTKNYTILQTKGSQGVNLTYLLYARDVVNALGATGVAANQLPVNIHAVLQSGTTYVFETDGNVAHGLAVGDLVTMSGSGFGGFTPSANPYTVAAVSFSGSYYLNRFTLVGVTLTSAAGTGSVVRNGIPGDYSATGGDYFHRTVPWNPTLVNPSCDPLTSTGSETTASSNNGIYCGAANDAPNGRPNAILAVGNAASAVVLGQQAFNDQISTWCSQCHTRYYSNTNQQSGTLEPSAALSAIPLVSSSGANISIATYAPTGVRYGGPGYGDKVTFAGTGNAILDSNEFLVIATGTGTFQVTLATNTLGGAAFVPAPTISTGTFTRTYQWSAASWWYPRNQVVPTDPYQFQHQTTTNRACVTCHVSHGSNALMTGQNGTDFSAQVPYPGGTYNGSVVSYSSRLLKVNNRGTCQMCHDPTGTVAAGTLSGVAQPVP
jgi:predicted CXXCH cytochrome family protein